MAMLRGTMVTIENQSRFFPAISRGPLGAMDSAEGLGRRRLRKKAPRLQTAMEVFGFGARSGVQAAARVFGHDEALHPDYMPDGEKLDELRRVHKSIGEGLDEAEEFSDLDHEALRQQHTTFGTLLGDGSSSSGSDSRRGHDSRRGGLDQALETDFAEIFQRDTD